MIAVVFLILQVLSSHTGFNHETWSTGAPLAQVLFELTQNSWLSTNLFASLASGLLISLQLLLVYRIISSVKNLDKYNLLVAWIYMLVTYLFGEWNDFTPALLAQTLLLLILYNIYKRNELQQDGFMFSVSTLISISFLLWYPSIFLLPFLLILLFQYNALSLKKLSILILSFSVPLIWYIIYFYATGQSVDMFYQFSSFHIQALNIQALHYLEWIPVGLIGIFALLGLLEAWSLSNKTSKNARLFISSLFTLILFLSLGFMLSTNRVIYSFQTVLFPAALFITLFVNNFKRTRYAEIAHIILLLAVLFNFVFQNFYH